MTLLWSVVPTDIVFEQQGTAPYDFKEIHVEGVTMVVRPLQNGQGRVERVISGNPQHYLRPDWQPGSTVALPNVTSN